MSKNGDEMIDSMKELITLLESLAESFPYLDDYDILVVEESQKPIIIMSPDEFLKVQRKVIGG